MKKIFMAIVAMTALFITGCSDNNTPEAVVNEAYECLQQKDYEGYLKLIAFENEDGKTADERREEALPLLKNKAAETIEKSGGIKSWKVTETNIAEDGKTAKVKTDVTYGNDKTEDYSTNVVLQDDGKWMLSSKK